MTNSTTCSPRRRRTLISRTARRLYVLAACLLCVTFPARSESPAPFIMSADVEPGTYVHRWAVLIYTEAFKRLGIPVQISNYSLARRSALVKEGTIDGEVSRIHAYGDANPDLIRIEEPVMDFSFALFTANSNVRLRRLEELESGQLIVEYRRGILMCENTLKKVVPAERLTNITSTEQGVKKLLTGRIDLYCDIETYVAETLHDPEFKNAGSVRKVLRIAAVPTYPYLHRKHAALAPRLTAVLKQMRAEGLLDAYPLQAEREMGWHQ